MENGVWTYRKAGGVVSWQPYGGLASPRLTSTCTEIELVVDVLYGVHHVRSTLYVHSAYAVVRTPYTGLLQAMEPQRLAYAYSV